MEYFFTTFFTTLFKTLVGLFAVSVFLSIYKHLSKRKLIERILQLPEEKRQIYIRSDSELILIYKMLLWNMPVILLAFVLTTYVFLPQFSYFTIVIVLGYIVILEDYFYRKSVLKAIDKK